MDRRPSLGPILIACGTILIVAALGVVGFQMGLLAEDVRDHRQQSAKLLREPRIDTVTLSQWEPPSIPLAWVATLGGFVLIGIGIRSASNSPDETKVGRRDDFA